MRGLKIKLILMSWVLLAGWSMANETIGLQAEGILRFNACIAEMVSHSLAANRDQAVDLYLALAPPRLEGSVKQTWSKHLNNFTKHLVDKEVESVELVAVERISTQTYIYRYLLHGSDGPLLFTAKAYQYNKRWYSCGFSFKSDIDDITLDLRDTKRLKDPMALTLPQVESIPQKKVINLLPHIALPVE
jgi:hypothetical protein